MKIVGVELHNKQKEIATDIINSDASYFIINASRQSGKDQRNDMLLYYDGYESTIGECKIGDRIFGDDGKLTTIIGKYPQGLKEQYKITLDDGRNFICGIGHLHQIYYHPSYNKSKGKDGAIRIVDTQFLIDHYLSGRNKPENCYILTAKPVQYTEKEHYIHPYLLGVLIGDGGLTNGGTNITSADEELINRCNELCPENYHITKCKTTKYNYAIRMIKKSNHSIVRKEIERLKLNVLSYFKHIPSEYIYDSYENRLELLKGLMDTDGYIDKNGGIEFCTTSLQLSNDITKLCRSLGMKVKVTDRITRFTDKNGNKKDGHRSYRVNIFTNISIFNLGRKSIRTKYNPVFDHSYKTRIVSIEKVEDAESTCIMVDNESHCYLTNDYTITHNTSCAIELVRYFALSKSNITILFVTPTYSLGDIIFNKIIDSLDGIPVLKYKNKSDLFAQFINGTKLYFRSAERYDNIRGISSDILFLDEFAFFKPDAWTAIKPTIAAKKSAKVIITSTPKGKQNEFYKMAMLGQSEDNNRYKYYFMHYTDNPYYNLDEVEDARRTMIEDIFYAEYEGRFNDGSGNVFKDGQLKLVQVISEWKLPVANNKYFAGIDVGKKDSTVLTIMDINGDVVYMYSTREKSYDIIIEEVVKILNVYNPLTYIEVNGVGDVFYDILIKRYSNLVAWRNTNEAKSNIIELLVHQISTQSIKLPTEELYKPLDFELKVFTYEYNPRSRKVFYMAEKPHHDDNVLSLAICNLCRNENQFTGKFSLYKPINKFSY